MNKKTEQINLQQQMKDEILNKKLLYLLSANNETIDDYNKINECLQKDLAVEDICIKDKKLVRSLSFVDVYEKRF